MGGLNNPTDNASERDVELDTGDDSDTDDVGQSDDVKKADDVSSGSFDWSGPVSRKPCLPSFMGERKVLKLTDNFELLDYFTL